MTNQQAFDTVLRHLRLQRVRSFHRVTPGDDGPPDDYDACAYRGPEGRMCAVGCLLPDEEYHPMMDQDSVAVDDMMRGGNSHFQPKSLADLSPKLLFDLQQAHDRLMPRELGGSLDNWEDEMRRAAGMHGLTYNVPTEA